MIVDNSTRYAYWNNIQLKLYQCAKDNPTLRFHSLLDKVYDIKNLTAALKHVKRGKKSKSDKKALALIMDNGEQEFLQGISSRLKNGTYWPSPVRRIYIKKGNGKKRPLGIPTIQDRVVQTALRMIMEPIFEADFYDGSFGYRPRRSGVHAIQRVQELLNGDDKFVVDVDIESCFDRIPHKPLLEVLSRRVVEGRLLDLIKRFLEAGVLENHRIINDHLGTPQGGSLSPLLANIYLNELDSQWVRNHQGYGTLVRYADDVIIVADTADQASQTLTIVASTLLHMGLNLSHQKTKVADLSTTKDYFDFLGFRHHKTDLGRLIIEPKPSSLLKLKEKVHGLCQKTTAPEMLINAVRQAVRDWWGYYHLSSDGFANPVVNELQQDLQGIVLDKLCAEFGFIYEEASGLVVR